MNASRLFSVVLIGGALCFSGCKEREAFEVREQPAPASLPHLWKVPEFELTERSGQPLRMADLVGKVWVADFFYTTCPGPCPMLSSSLSKVQTAVGENPEVRLVSISVDPDKDTTEVLKVYAERFKAGANWFFCTGKKSDIYSLAKEGFKLPLTEASEGEAITHTTRLALVDRTGTVRGFYEGATEAGVDDLIRDLRRLLEEKDAPQS